MRFILTGVVEDLTDMDNVEMLNLIENYVFTEEVWCDFYYSTGKLYKKELKEVCYVDLVDIEDLVQFVNKIPNEFEISFQKPKFQLPFEVTGWLHIDYKRRD